MPPISCNSAITIISVGLLTACASSESAPLNESITEAELRADVRALSHDSTRGRLVGTPELEESADWIRNRFEAIGIEPAAGNNSYDQRFDLMWFSLGAENSLATSMSEEAHLPGEGWYPLNFSATGSATGDVVFAGYGMVEPRLGYDDYQEEDVRGKIVLVLDGEPHPEDAASPFDGLVTAEASRSWRKALAAQERGASGILIVEADEGSDETDWEQAASRYWPDEPRRIERFTLRDWMEEITIPGAAISVELANQLISGSGSTFEQLVAAARTTSSGFGVTELPGSRVSFKTAVDRHTTPGRNILGMIEGSDPALKDELVIIIGHNDMNGTDGDIIYNGADDNASGTAGVLEVAEAYAQAAEQGLRPRRSVLFVVSDAEERGPSLGAWYLTLDPVVPLEQTAAVFNVDMIGRNEEVPEDGGGRFWGLEPQSAESNSNAVNIIGYSWSPELAAVVESANALTDLTLRQRYDNNQSNMLRRSDQWPFIQNGVPAIWFHTGLHPDYHTPEDDYDRLNYEKMTRIVKLLHQASWDVANADGRPNVNEMGSRPIS